MTAATQLIEKLRARPEGGIRIDYMIEELFTQAMKAPVSLINEHLLPSGLTVRIGSDDCRDTESGLLRLLRPLLARLAYMLAEENGTEFDPYGGDLVARRNGVELAIHFENTSVLQGLTITRNTAPVQTEPHAIPSGRNGLSERSLSQPQACES